MKQSTIEIIYGITVPFIIYLIPPCYANLILREEFILPQIKILIIFLSVFNAGLFFIIEFPLKKHSIAFEMSYFAVQALFLLMFYVIINNTSNELLIITERIYFFIEILNIVLLIFSLFARLINYIRKFNLK